MKFLKDRRDEIDVLDAELTALLERRFELSKEIGHFKKVQGLRIQDENREQMLMEAIEQRVEKADNILYIQRVYEAILTQSKEAQKYL
ncbi:chorismate mutase [Fusibacter sp. JL298sf-3]